MSDLERSILDLVARNGGPWTGTATALFEELGVSVTPHQFARDAKEFQSVTATSHRTNTARIWTLSVTSDTSKASLGRTEASPDESVTECEASLEPSDASGDTSKASPWTDIETALVTLCGDERPIEIRAISPKGSGRTNPAHLFESSSEAAKCAYNWSESEYYSGVYFNLNAIRPGLRLPSGHAYKDEHVERRRWVLVDVEALKPSSTSNASEEEMSACFRFVRKLREQIQGDTETIPVLTCSGNGYHLLYRVDLESTEDARNAIKGFLRGLQLWAVEMNARAQVDLVPHNAGRICKLPGTVARKGPVEDGRPQRRAGIINGESYGTLTLDYLRSWAPVEEVKPAADVPAMPVASSAPGRPDHIARAQHFLDIREQRKSGNGRNSVTYSTACWLLNDMALTPGEAWPMLCKWNAAGPEPYSSTEMEKLWENVLKYSGNNPKGAARNKTKDGFTGGSSIQHDGYVAPRKASVNACAPPTKTVTVTARASEELPAVEETPVHEDVPPPTDNDGPDDGEQKPWEYQQTQLGNAELLHSKFRGILKYCSTSETWFHWTGRNWSQDELHRAGSIANQVARHRLHQSINIEEDGRRKKEQEWAKTSESSDQRRGTLSQYQTLPEVCFPVSRLDADPWLINVQNGTIDLKTGQLHQHDSGQYQSKILPVGYDPEARAPLWMAFLDRVMAGDRDLVRYLGRYCGYTLTGSTQEQTFATLYGSGANGKSVFAETIGGLMGDYSETAAKEAFMTRKNQSGPSPELAMLKGARFVRSAETQENGSLNESLIKQLTGGDEIAARFCHGNFFKFKPECKLFILSNYKPEIKGLDEGIWRRVQLIPFGVSIPKSEQDESFPSKLREEWPGILAWMVRGCLEWQRYKLCPPKAVQDAVDSYRREMDVVGRFVDERCNLGESAVVDRVRLYGQYQIWCELNGEPLFRNATFYRKLEQKNFKDCKRQGVRMYKGLDLKADQYTAPVREPKAYVPEGDFLQEQFF